MPTRHNSAIYKDSVPQVDAGCIQILKAAGALILGKTTTTEFASTKYGPKTCNPHDSARTPGGSSSGSAAAVADYQAPVALGTQTGGSMIRPGSFNGIYAFKPTWGSLSREGVKFSAVMYDTLGFFARSVYDLDILADVFAIHDDVPPSLDFRIEGAKFALVRTWVWDQAGPGTRSAVGEAARLLRQHGATVDEVNLPEMFHNLKEWYWTVLNSEGRVTFLPEHRIGKEHLHQDLIDQVQNTHKISRKSQLEASDGIASLRPVIDSITERYDAIIAPSVPDVAPLGQGFTGDQVFNNMWTALHVPVINVPGFKGEGDMPIGVSLISGRYHDRHLLNVAKSVGGIFDAEGGWKSSVLEGS